MEQRLKDPAHTVFPPATGIGNSSFEGLETEHILIEDELSPGDAKPATVADRRLINNRIRGLLTELTLYSEGFLRVREGTKRQPHKNHLIETRFLDPDFQTNWLFSRGWLWLLGAALVSTAAAWLLLPIAGLASSMPYGVALGLLLSALAVCQLMRKTRQIHSFFTASGRALVLRLEANLGCLRKSRKAARAVGRAIRETVAGSDSGDMRQLRAEMQAHYRLLEKGVISKDVCSRSTAEILAKFG